MEPPSSSSFYVDAFAWVSNIVTTLLVIFLSKWAMTIGGFAFATTLSALHFAACAVAMRSAAAAGVFPHITLPHDQVLLFSLVSSSSIASANISLMLNTIGFYQISKLMLVPFVCGIEMVVFGKQFSSPALVSVCVTVVGVGIVVWGEVGSTTGGKLTAAIFIVTSGLQQILTGHFQKKFSLQSYQLLANTATMQAAILLLVGPSLDNYITGSCVTSWKASTPGLTFIVLSSLVAVGVNLSQFLCLGRFSATSFQVLGHSKTILVLLGGWALFNEIIVGRKLIGIALSLSGMMAYGYFMTRNAAEAPALDGPPRAGRTALDGSPSRDRTGRTGTILDGSPSRDRAARAASTLEGSPSRELGETEGLLPKGGSQGAAANVETLHLVKAA